MDDEVTIDGVNNPEYTVYLTDEDEEQGKKDWEEAKKRAGKSSSTETEDTPATPAEPTTGSDTVFDGATITSTIVLKETFTATNSTITISSGDTFSATNVTSDAHLTNNQISNSDATSAFLREQESTVTMTLSNQVAEGDIILDNLSSLNLVLSDTSYYMGIINGTNAAKSVSLSLDGTSQFILAGDSYIDTLTNADSTNMNIFGSGYKLYVAGEEVAINSGVAPEVPTPTEPEPTEPEPSTVEPTPEPVTPAKEATNMVPIIVAIVAVLVIIAGVVAVFLHNKKKNGPTSPTGPMTPPPTPDGGRPDFSAFDDGPAAQPIQPAAPAAPTNPFAPGASSAPSAPTTPTVPPTPSDGSKPISPINPFNPNPGA